MTEPRIVALIEQWRAEAQRLDARYGQAAQARLTEAHIADLERTLEASSNEVVSLTDAAAISGYSAGYLGRLVRDGALRNHGTKARPKVRRVDVPMKPSAVFHTLPTSSEIRTVSPTREQIARAVITRHQ